MVFHEGGRVTVGTEAEEVERLLAGRPPDIRKLFLYESPPHEVQLPPYFIGRYEVTNAQYRLFLEDHPVVHVVAEEGRRTLDDLAAACVGLSTKQQADPRQRVWRQLYAANREAVWRALGERVADLVVERPDGSVDEGRTAERFRHETLPPGTTLRFFRLRPPRNWPGTEPSEDQADHPVRFVSYDDAEHFAEWAGGHLPTEAEWEWAARGPDGRTFPWGDEWFDDASHANWGGKVVDERFEVTTLPVDGLPGGRSWCGCHHMAGNVAEWTSSWFDAYPGNPERHPRMGSWVKVIRGGGAADGEWIVLRCACRNWVGAGAKAPPFPENSFEWCGFRLAAYPDPVRDRLGPVVRRATRPKKIRPARLATDQVAGAATRPWVAPDGVPAGHVYALGASQAVLVIPLRSFLQEEGLTAMRRAWARAGELKTVADVLELGATDPWPLAVLHTDVKLGPVEVPESQPPRGPRRRRRPPPTLVRGTCPPGTYVVASLRGRLALLDPWLEIVGFLPGPEGRPPRFDLVRIEPPVRRAALALDAPLDWAELDLAVPLGGRRVDPRLHVTVSAVLEFEVGALECAGLER